MKKLLRMITSILCFYMNLHQPTYFSHFCIFGRANGQWWRIQGIHLWWFPMLLQAFLHHSKQHRYWTPQKHGWKNRVMILKILTVPQIWELVSFLELFLMQKRTFCTALNEKKAPMKAELTTSSNIPWRKGRIGPIHGCYNGWVHHSGAFILLIFLFEITIHQPTIDSLL